VYARSTRRLDRASDDEVVLAVGFADGSVGTIAYAASGDRALGKERIEVFGEGKAAVLDDYRTLELVRDGRRRRRRAWLRADKGHRAEWESVLHAARNGSSAPIPPAEIVGSHLAVFGAMESLRSGEVVELHLEGFLEG
jgi:polar amino acid transport system substrate-binding protein